MPIAKSNEVDQTAPAPVTTAFKRVLDTPKSEEPRREYKSRDFDAEARGKVACAAYNAALASPGLAMFTYASRAEYLAAVKEAADASVAYTWAKQKDGV